MYHETAYTAIYHNENDLDHNHYYDCCVFEIIDADFKPLSNSHPPPLEIVPGNKVYFAGYPLGQSNPSFHEGTVSSADQDDTNFYFSIDASVIPGNSGGPVFILKDNAPLLVGMIFAELAQIDTGFIRESQSLRNRLSGGGGGVSIGDVDVLQMMSKTIDVIFGNLATGIGKVISIKHVNDLFMKTPLPKIQSPFTIGFPIVKTEYLPGLLGKDSDYLEWYHRRVKGKTLCGTILGRILDASDQVDQKDEKILRRYYEENILSQYSGGYQEFEQSPYAQFETLKDKILSAKPKALKLNGEKWRSLLLKCQTELPGCQARITKLLTSLPKCEEEKIVTVPKPVDTTASNSVSSSNSIASSPSPCMFNSFPLGQSLASSSAPGILSFTQSDSVSSFPCKGCEEKK